MNLKRFATTGLIIFILLITLFYLKYEDYQYTFKRQERIIQSNDKAKEELNKSIYKLMKRETQKKTDKIAADIKKALVEEYNGNMEKFKSDYDSKEENTSLMKVLDKIINNDENRFYYVESDSNDMFVASDKGIIYNKSEDSSIDKSLEKEYLEKTSGYNYESEKHYNKSLAKEAFKSMKLGKNENIFWRFKNTDNTTINLTEMNIDKLLSLDFNNLKDYEFLTISYIDKYSDILGVDSVSSNGIKQKNRQLIIVQGFNMYEQIIADFNESYLKLEKDKQMQLKIIEENRRTIMLELILSVIIAFTAFLSISALQNSYVRECLLNGELK